MSEDDGGCPLCKDGDSPSDVVPVFLGPAPNAKIAYVPVKSVRKAVNIKLRTGAPEGDKVAHESGER